MQNTKRDCVKKMVLVFMPIMCESRKRERKWNKICFQLVSCIELTKRVLEEMILVGRDCWKKDLSKKGLYRIKHLNYRNSNAMKNHYLFTQMAHILMQLYLAWNTYVKEQKQSIKIHFLVVLATFLLP